MFRFFIVAALCICTSFFSYAAEKDSTKVESYAKVNIKFNAAAVVGIVNPAIEVRVLPHASVQLEGIGIFYPKNFLGTGYPLSWGGGWGEFRYYPKEVFHGFFGGLHAGWAVFRLNKNIIPSWLFGYEQNHSTVQIGENIMIGATLGWAHSFGDHWGIELSISGGWQRAQYESYTPRPDGLMSHLPLNHSGEWIPYKAGIYICYKF